MQTADPGSASLKLLVLGFNENERRLLQSIVKLSQRRSPTLHLLPANEGQGADVILIDGQDEGAMKWAAAQPWLRSKAVAWVDHPTGEVPGTHTVLKRPVQWTILPALISRIMAKAGAQDASAHAATEASAGQTAAPTPSAAPAPQATAAAPGPAQPAQAAPAAQAAAPAGKKQVLVVDDSLAVRQQLMSFLEKRGMSASYAESGDDAVAKCQNTPYDCILLDVLMPGMDGYETCRRIKAMPHMLKKVKVVMLTSRTSPFDRIRGKMAGCDAYLTKPVQAQKLYETLSQFLAA